VLADNGAALMSVVKSGSGTIALTGANTYTGPTTIFAGATFQPCEGNQGALASPVVTNNGTLKLVRQDNAVFIYSGNIVGTGNVVKDLNNTQGGDVTLTGAPSGHLGAFMDALSDVGVSLTCDGDQIHVRGAAPGSGAYVATDISTAPYPGLATDLQPPTAVLLTQARGTSHVHETIFEDRLEWMSELVRMGAGVTIEDDHHATLHGPCSLRGTELEMHDLRAGVSLILAALVADGQSVIHGAHQVRRGYENIERKFLDLGARIEHVSEG